MKYHRYLLVLLFAFVLAACYEVNEEVVINENGSGVFESKMDLSKLVELATSFAGEEELVTGKTGTKMDTVFSVRDLLDSADEQQGKFEWMKNGKVFLNMDLKNNLLKMDLRVPYSNYSQLQQLMESQGYLLNKSIMGLWNAPKPDSVKKQDDASFQDLVGVYNVELRNGFINRKVDSVKFREFMMKSQVSELKQMIKQGVEISYTTNFKLPRAVKKITNPLLKVSEDKRTVTLKYNLLEIVNDPAKFAYSIEY